MRQGRLFLLSILVVSVGMTLARGQEPRPILAQDFDKIHTMIKRQNGEWRWAELNWSINFADAQRRSMAEGRPIFVVLAAQGSVVGCL